MSTLKVYSTSVTGSREIKSQQSEVTRILDGKNIKYELVDISQDNALREEMRAKAGNPKAIPPQIVNGDHYCGGSWAGGLGVLVGSGAVLCGAVLMSPCHSPHN
uniref:SH3 domain-binding glutamic acid-rich-like protein 3 n=1 Tax=Melopsittacus undulatus TaxID=13146 RepID=A0A8V5HCG2_MELUD